MLFKRLNNEFQISQIIYFKMAKTTKIHFYRKLNKKTKNCFNYLFLYLYITLHNVSLFIAFLLVPHTVFWSASLACKAGKAS